MKELDINAFSDFNDREIGRRVLSDDPVMRVMLMSLRAGQSLPEHVAGGLVTVYSVGGRVLFYEGSQCAEMIPGKFLRLAPGGQHRLEAKEDSRLLITMIRPADASAWTAMAPNGRALDLRETPRERRHSTVFYAFDQLEVGEWFHLVNDHDPQPLHAQMEQYRPGELAWEYEARGPYEFRIKVSRVARAASSASEAGASACGH